MNCRRTALVVPALAAAGVFVAASSLQSAAAPPNGYADYEKFRSQVQELEKSDVVRVRSLATTAGGREVYLLTLGTGETGKKPAILIVGNVHAPHLAASEVALRLAFQVARNHQTDQRLGKLLERHTLYIIPRPSPDATEKCFQKPLWEHTGNLRKTDDDRDGQAGEDPPEDLNGDGLITMMRVADQTGDYLPHPDDPRVMIQADPKKNERGQYKLFVEGRDNDGDEKFNEDAGEGVDFNRNWTFQYPYFESGAGPNQVSEPETRAVADFAFSRPNIAAVLTFTPEDNLLHPWKPDSGAEKQRIKTTVQSADAPYADYMAEKYRKSFDAKDPPTSPEGKGSFSEWVYFHYGRWSPAARMWWIPKVAAEAVNDDQKASDADDANQGGGEAGPAKKTSEEKRGADEVNALRWLAEQKTDGFVEWAAVEHPDFPGKQVEVGGFKPFVRLNPPAELLDALAEKHTGFVLELADLLPALRIADVKVEPLGKGLFRLHATVANTGYLPTMPAMGRINGEVYPVQVSLDLPEGGKLISGHRHTRLDPLAGAEGTQRLEWLLLAGEQKEPTLTIRAGSPSTGTVEQVIELK